MTTDSHRTEQMDDGVYKAGDALLHSGKRLIAEYCLLEISYDLNEGFGLDDEADRIPGNHRGVSTDSGAGFGRRDKMYEFDNRGDAEATISEFQADGRFAVERFVVEWRPA